MKSFFGGVVREKTIVSKVPLLDAELIECMQKQKSLSPSSASYESRDSMREKLRQRKPRKSITDRMHILHDAIMEQ